MTGRACLMACWNTFIPYLAPELPEKQKEALAYGVKRPLVITNVAIRNAQDGISVVQTAEGALSEVHSILQRMRDLSVQAANSGSQDANAVAAEVYLGLLLDPWASGCSSSYYGGSRYESPGGRRLAELVQETVPAQLCVPDRGAHGMSFPVLRETRMPAVVCELGPPLMLVERSNDIARAVREALDTWVRAAWD